MGEVSTWRPSLGAVHLGDNRSRFRVWAPLAERVELELVCLIHLDAQEGRLDPASRFQVDGVYGPSVVIDSAFDWEEAEADWRGLPLEDFILYELHVGTFAGGARWTKILDSAAESWGGPGSAAPAEVESRGEAAVPVAGRSVVLYHTPL